MPMDGIQGVHCLWSACLPQPILRLPNKWLCSQFFLPAEGWWLTPATLWLCSPSPVPAGINTQ